MYTTKPATVRTHVQRPSGLSSYAYAAHWSLCAQHRPSCVSCSLFGIALCVCVYNNNRREWTDYCSSLCEQHDHMIVLIMDKGCEYICGCCWNGFPDIPLFVLSLKRCNTQYIVPNIKYGRLSLPPLTSAVFPSEHGFHITASEV